MSDFILSLRKANELLEAALSATIDENTTELELLYQTSLATLSQGRFLFWAGNGGSAADCQHFSTELSVRYNKDRPALRSISLSTDTTLITAASNDLGFNQVFSRQINALASENDALISLSTSGNSLNVLEAITAARSKGLKTMSLFGAKSHHLSISDITITIQSANTAIIQECQKVICHRLCESIEAELYGQ